VKIKKDSANLEVQGPIFGGNRGAVDKVAPKKGQHGGMAESRYVPVKLLQGELHHTRQEKKDKGSLDLSWSEL